MSGFVPVLPLLADASQRPKVETLEIRMVPGSVGDHVRKVDDRSRTSLAVERGA